jgi:hypothetical protein
MDTDENDSRSSEFAVHRKVNPIQSAKFYLFYSASMLIGVHLWFFVCMVPDESLELFLSTRI